MIINITLNNCITDQELINFGFRNYGNTYKFSIPICSYKERATITLDFYINIKECKAEYAVINQSDFNYYTPFYDRKYGTNENVNKADKLLNKYILKLQQAKILNRGL